MNIASLPQAFVAQSISGGKPMKKIADGIFAAQGIMPCRPQDIKVFRYGFPRGTLRFDHAESAARILVFSQQFGFWVGVSWTRLIAEIHKDVAVQKLAAGARREEKERYDENCVRYQRMQTLTFGLYSLFRNPPELPKKIISIPRTASHVWLAGTQYVVMGFKELIDEELLSLVTIEGENILFPTFRLVREIMDRQQSLAA